MKLPTTRVTDRGFTVEGAGPALLSELLNEYEARIRRSDPQTWATVRPGRSRAEILDALGGIGIESPPEEVIVWWMWSDGNTFTAPRGLRLAQIGLDAAIAMRHQERSFTVCNCEYRAR